MAKWTNAVDKSFYWAKRYKQYKLWFWYSLAFNITQLAVIIWYNLK